MATGLKVENVDHNHAVGHTDQVIFVMWRHHTTLEAVRGLTPITEMLNERGATGILTVVEKGATLPSSEARAELASSLKTARSMVCSALVFEGDGFRAAAVRAITTTIYQLAKPPFPLRVFATVEQAAHWMESFQVNIEADGVIASVGELRAALDQH